VGKDPDQDPEIEENMLSHEADLARLKDGIRRVEALAQTPAFQAITHRIDYGTTGRAMSDPMTDRELDHFVMAECSDAQHASGTCRMGAPNDPRSVVDPQCRVLGTTGLRVIDASIMPEVPRANTHLTTVAIAEKMAAHLT
jgi:choline dehydrogenase